MSATNLFVFQPKGTSTKLIQRVRAQKIADSKLGLVVSFQKDDVLRSALGNYRKRDYSDCSSGSEDGLQVKVHKR